MTENLMTKSQRNNRTHTKDFCMKTTRRGFLGMIAGAVGAATFGKFAKHKSPERVTPAKVHHVDFDGDCLIAGEPLYSGDLAVVEEDGTLHKATCDTDKPLSIVLKNALPGERTESASNGRWLVNIQEFPS